MSSLLQLPDVRGNDDTDDFIVFVAVAVVVVVVVVVDLIVSFCKISKRRSRSSLIIRNSFIMSMTMA